MLAEQVGGHTPTLEGLRWRRDAHPRRAVVGQLCGIFVGCLCCRNVNLFSGGKARGVADTHTRAHTQTRFSIGVYITRQQPLALSR